MPFRDLKRVKEQKIEVYQGTKAKISISETFCKGCGLCVDICPANVLRMDLYVVKVVDIEKCTLCNQCELICPDFAIWVERVGEKKGAQKKEKASEAEN